MPSALWTLLDRYLAGETTLAELAAALEGRDDPLAALPAGAAQELRAAVAGAASGRSAERDVLDAARAVYERHRPGRLAADRAARIARGMLDGTINVAAGVRTLARQRAAGSGWIPEAFAGIADALDAPPSARGSDALAARLDESRHRAAALRAPALVAARRLLESLSDDPG